MASLAFEMPVVVRWPWSGGRRGRGRRRQSPAVTSSSSRSALVWRRLATSPSPSPWSSWPCGGRSSSSGGSSAQPTMLPSSTATPIAVQDQVEDQAVADQRERRTTARSASTTATAGATADGSPIMATSSAVAIGTRRPCSSSPYLRCQKSSSCGDDRVVVEVVLGGGRRDAPLEAAGVPRVGAGRRAATDALRFEPHDVDEEHQNAERR